MHMKKDFVSPLVKSEDLKLYLEHQPFLIKHILI